MKIAAIHLNGYMDYARVRGIAVPELIQLLKNAPSDFSDEAAQIDVEDFYRVLKFIDGRLKDELWGIKAGNFLTLKLLGIIYQLSLQATTIEEALHYLQSYLDATLPLVKAQIDGSEKAVVIQFEIPNDDDAINRVILENMLAIISREITFMSRKHLSISLTSPFFNTAYPAGWEKSGSFGISFEPGILKAALRPYDQFKLDVLIPAYLQLVEQWKPSDSFGSAVKVTMLSMSDLQLPGIQTIADALFLTPRTLQRRLGEENLTFRKVTEELKKKVSTLLLQHDKYPVAVIAGILGYSEPASFIHAFKKWHGDAPLKTRARWKAAPFDI
ncbi:helix-turn-helix domain-containing protein [Mucilaginibacter sp. HD30]